jgi:hypothetical protein
VPEPGNPQSLNRYSYTLNNPLRYVDPTGHAPTVELGAGGGGGGGIVLGWWGLNQALQSLTVEVQAFYAKAYVFLTGASHTIGDFLQASGDKVPAIGDQIANTVESAKNQAQSGSQGGNTADPGGLDPNKLRQAYESEVRSLADKANEMREGGSSKEEIARSLHAARRALGVKYKDMTPPEALKAIYQRNVEKYGDRLGPSIEWLLEHGKSWDDIIESACRPGGGDIVSKLLGN